MSEKNTYRFTISFDPVTGKKLESMMDRSQYVRDAVHFYKKYADMLSIQVLLNIQLTLSALQKQVELLEGQIDREPEKKIPEKEPGIIRDSIMEMLKK